MGDTLVVGSMVRDLAEVIPPLILMIGGITAGIVAMFFRAKSKERAHRERMAYIERGVEVPPPLYEKSTKSAGDYRTIRMLLVIGGMLGIFIGIGAGIAVTLEEGAAKGAGGLIGILIGVGLLASERLIVQRILKNGNGD